MKKLPYYKDTGHVMIPFGDDFYWAHATFNFYNVDKLIKFVNKNTTSRIKIRYSTASEYFDAIE